MLNYAHLFSILPLKISILGGTAVRSKPQALVHGVYLASMIQDHDGWYCYSLVHSNLPKSKSARVSWGGVRAGGPDSPPPPFGVDFYHKLSLVRSWNPLKKIAAGPPVFFWIPPPPPALRLSLIPTRPILTQGCKHGLKEIARKFLAKCRKR